MQVTLNKWTLDGTRYAYAQSQELIVTPSTFRLAPGQQQIIRIGLRNGPPAMIESAYRLLVEEVPPPPSADVTQTLLVIRHDVPVFVTPMVAGKSVLAISVDCATDGARLRVTNTGNVHALLRNVLLESLPAKERLANWGTFDYLLPGAQQSWKLDQVAPTASGKPFLLTTQTDQGLFTADVQNTCH
jgi:fimbrial chaperone protein